MTDDPKQVVSLVQPSPTDLNTASRLASSLKMQFDAKINEFLGLAWYPDVEGMQRCRDELQKLVPRYLDALESQCAMMRASSK